MAEVTGKSKKPESNRTLFKSKSHKVATMRRMYRDSVSPERKAELSDTESLIVKNTIRRQIRKDNVRSIWTISLLTALIVVLVIVAVLLAVMLAEKRVGA